MNFRVNILKNIKYNMYVISFINASKMYSKMLHNKIWSNQQGIEIYIEFKSTREAFSSVSHEIKNLVLKK